MKRQDNTPPVWAAGAALLLILVAIACQPVASGDSPPLSPSATLAPADGTPLSATTTPVAGAEGPVPAPTGTAPEASPPTGQEVVLLAKQDLAQRLKIAPEHIVVRSVEPVTWPDTSLGCPQPGMMYAQVLTPGYRVVLLAADKRYTYHSDRQGRIVCCEPNGEQMFVSGGSKQAVEFARGDLAQRLGISSEGISLVSTIGQDFSADAFYCRTTKDRITRDESPAVISGLSILLEAAGRRYEYHASDQEVVFCRQLPY